MDLKAFTQAIQQIADEKNIPREKIIETIEMALAAAYKRDYGKRGQIIRARMDPETGAVEVRQIKIVVDESMVKSEEEIEAEEAAKAEAVKRAEQKEETKEQKNTDGMSPEISATEGIPADAAAEEEKRVRFNEEKHLMLDEAKKIKKDVAPGDELEFPLEYHEEFGRIAAQTAKQVIIQRIREIEREAIFDEYKEKEGELMSGLVQRIEGRNVFIDIGRTVGILPPEEQIPRERYHIGERLKTLLVLVEKNPRGPGVLLSRSHPRLVTKLFEVEVPEIAAGTVEIKSIAREPGSRSKIAVVSHEEGVDPVGSLVGQKGVRVSTVINELNGEKIDIIEWSDDASQFISHALSPAKVLDVAIDEEQKEARVIVPEDQLSLAIGRGGQNVRLAAKLTGWKIDVRAKEAQKVTEGEEPGAEENAEEGTSAQETGKTKEDEE